jgi:HSP20 family protein
VTIIRRNSPFGEMLSLRQAMDRLFEDSWVRPGSVLSEAEHALAIDVRSTPESFVVEAALPGVKPDDVDISVLGDTLTISARTAEEKSTDDNGYSYREIRRGSFTRSLTLPRGLKSDAAVASFDNGLLRLSIPKAEESKPRQIQIRPTTDLEAGPTEAGDVPAEQNGTGN